MVNTWDMRKSKISTIRNFMIKEYESVKNMIPKRAKTIIDMGCGEGHLTKYLKDKGYNITGIDTNITIAKKYYPDCDFKKGNAYNPVNTKNDCTILNFIIEHLQNPLLAINSTRYNSKCIIIVLPNEPLFEILSKIKNLGRNVGHINHFTPTTAKNLLSYYGKVTQNKTLLYTINKIEV